MTRLLRLTCLISVLLGATNAEAVIAVRQFKTAGGAGAATRAVTVTATLAGSVVACGASSDSNGGTVTSITFTDGSSDTPTNSSKGTIVGNVGSSAMAAFFTVTTGVTTFTAHFSATPGSFTEIVCWEITGMTTPSFDKAVEAGGTTGTAMSSGATGTLASSTEIGLGYLISNVGAAANSQGTGWTPDGASGNGLTTNGNFSEHIVTSTTASITATATQGSGAFDAWAITLKVPGAVTCLANRSLLGVGC